MVTRTWGGLLGEYQVAANWLGGVVPAIGDSVMLTNGAMTMLVAYSNELGCYDGLAIILGSAAAGSPAGLVLDGVAIGFNTTITSSGRNAYGMVAAIGTVPFYGQIMANAAGGTLTIQASVTDSSLPADFVLMNGGTITVQNGDTLVQTGRMDVHGTVSVGSSGSVGTFSVGGSVNLSGASMTVYSGATLTGGGTVSVGMYSSLFLMAGSAPSSVSVTFGQVGGRLRLGAPASYTGQISNFLVGDIIDLTNTSANYAISTNGILTVYSGGAQGRVVATL